MAKNISPKKLSSKGFTLSEVLIASVIGGIILSISSGLIINILTSSGNLEKNQRTRKEWERVSHFIESEIALSEKVITKSTSPLVDYGSCVINSSEFLFALKIKPNLNDLFTI